MARASSDASDSSTRFCQNMTQRGPDLGDAGETGTKGREEFARWAIQLGLDEPLDAEPDIP
jgi:hypothetical protein